MQVLPLFCGRIITNRARPGQLHPLMPKLLPGGPLSNRLLQQKFWGQCIYKLKSLSVAFSYLGGTGLLQCAVAWDSKKNCQNFVLLDQSISFATLIAEIEEWYPRRLTILSLFVPPRVPWRASTTWSTSLWRTATRGSSVRNAALNRSLSDSQSFGVRMCKLALINPPAFLSSILPALVGRGWA